MNNDATTNTESPIEQSDLFQVHLARRDRQSQGSAANHPPETNWLCPTVAYFLLTKLPIFLNFTPQKPKKKYCICNEFRSHLVL